MAPHNRRPHERAPASTRAQVIQAWGRILAGYRPNLSIEITRECPLRCPGCYAYGDEHLGGGVTLRGLADYKGDELVERFMALVDRASPAARVDRRRRAAGPVSRAEHDPAAARRARHLYAAGDERGPADSAGVDRAASPADRRLDRRPAARARRAAHAGDLRPHPEAHRRTPDHRALHGDAAAGAARGLPRGVPADLAGESEHAADLDQPLHAAEGRAVGRAADGGRPRRASSPTCGGCGRSSRSCSCPTRCSPSTRSRRSRPTECIFAQTTECFSADLERRITPCQFGGDPDCTNCGCMASAGLEAIGRHRLGGGIPVGRIFYASTRIGRTVARLRSSA